MMVIVPRIAVVSCFSTTPFIYGIQHEDNLRAGLLLSDQSRRRKRKRIQIHVIRHQHILGMYL